MAGDEFVSEDGRYILNERGFYYRNDESIYVLAEDSQSDHFCNFHEKNKEILKPEFLLWDNWTGWNVTNLSSEKKGNRKRRNSAVSQVDDRASCTILYKSTTLNSYCFAVVDLSSFLVKKFAKIESSSKNLFISDVCLVCYPNMNNVGGNFNFLLAVCNNVIMELVSSGEGFVFQRYEPLEHHTCVGLMHTMQVGLKNSELVCTDVLVGTFVNLLEDNSSVKSCRLQFFYYRFKKKTGFYLLHSYNVPSDMVFSFFVGTGKSGLKTLNVRSSMSLFFGKNNNNLLGIRSHEVKKVASNFKFPNLLTFFHFSQSEMGFLHCCSFDDIVYAKCRYFAEFQAHQNFLTLYMVLKRRQTVEVFSVLAKSDKNMVLKDALFEIGFNVDDVRIVSVNCLQREILLEVNTRSDGKFGAVGFAMSGLVLGKNVLDVAPNKFDKKKENEKIEKVEPSAAPLEAFLNGKRKVQFIAEEEQNIKNDNTNDVFGNKTAANSLSAALNTSDQKLIDQILKGLPADVAANTVRSLSGSNLALLLDCIVERILARPRRVNELVKWLKTVAEEFSKKKINKDGRIERALQQIEMFADLKTHFYPSICRIKSRLENSLERFRHMRENETEMEKDAAPLFSFTHEDEEQQE